MPLTIKRNGNRPQSVGKLVVPWMIYDKDQKSTIRMVTKISVNPELMQLAVDLANSSEGEWLALRVRADNLLRYVRNTGGGL